jgi:hypothetical protein
MLKLSGEFVRTPRRWAATSLVWDLMARDERVDGLHSVRPPILLARDLAVPRSAVLVYDQEASDYYTKDLHADFSRAFAKNVTYVRPYTPDENDTAVEFNQIVDDVCSTSGPPPCVFYAGRESVLTILIAQFPGDPGCSGKKITMVTGGDADGLNPAATATT